MLLHVKRQKLFDHEARERTARLVQDQPLLLRRQARLTLHQRHIRAFVARLHRLQNNVLHDGRVHPVPLTFSLYIVTPTLYLFNVQWLVLLLLLLVLTATLEERDETKRKRDVLNFESKK